MILVVSGPGGVGKGTVLRELLAGDPRLWLSRSWTTRPRRPGEAADSYYFVSPDEFMTRVAEGGFIEWVEFLDYLQGSPIADPPPGHDTVFELDVRGARSILDRYDGAVSVFLDAPSVEEQEARLRARGESDDRIAQRIQRARDERIEALDLGSRVIINHTVPGTVAELRELIERVRRGPLEKHRGGDC